MAALPFSSTSSCRIEPPRDGIGHSRTVLVRCPRLDGKGVHGTGQGIGQCGMDKPVAFQEGPAREAGRYNPDPKMGSSPFLPAGVPAVAVAFVLHLQACRRERPFQACANGLDRFRHVRPTSRYRRPSRRQPARTGPAGDSTMLPLPLLQLPPPRIHCRRMISNQDPCDNAKTGGAGA